MKFRLLIDFENEEELIEYIMTMRKKTIKKDLKKIDDKRGSKTTELHRKAKDYKLNNPNVPYRQCLIRVSNPLNQIQTDINVPTDDEDNLKDILINVDNSI